MSDIVERLKIKAVFDPEVRGACDEITRLRDERERLRKRVGELEEALHKTAGLADARGKALEEIANHPACSYEYHRPAQSGGDRQYQIGVTDGHRLAAKIARRTLDETATP